VQGETAPESLCYALDKVARWGDADVLIIGRGGGGREDLWAFNDERVARALADCPMPTISAVGHEVDMSICDLVADLRAPTPSAAAEAAVPVQAELRERLRASAAALSALASYRIERARITANDTARHITASAARRTERGRLQLESAAGKLNALSPLATLERGYAIVRAADRRTVRSIDSLEPGAQVDIVLRDGKAAATIDHLSPNEAQSAGPAQANGGTR
jgi:exodeoxyribonuclease VII large subunit